MKLDDTTKEVTYEVQQELKKEGIDISIEEIIDVVGSQFLTANLAFKKCVDVRVPYFGTFTRKHGVEMSKAGIELNKLKDSVSAEEFKRLRLEKQLEFKEKKKIRRKKMSKFTLKDIKATKDVINNKHRYDKILKDED